MYYQGGRDYRSSVCLRNVFTSRREYLPSSLLSLLSRGTLVPSRTQRGWIRSGTREEGERGRGGEGEE